MKFKLSVLDKQNLEWHLVIKTNLLNGDISLIESHECNTDPIDDCALCDLFMEETKD